MSERYLIGLDLGQQQDFTALSIVKRLTVVTRPAPPPDPEARFQRVLQPGARLSRTAGLLQHRGALTDALYRPAPAPQPETANVYQVGHLERFPLGTRYPDMVRRVIQTMKQLPRMEAAAPLLIIDKTGVGGPVSDFFREENVPHVGISIHGGDKVTRQGQQYNVPKRDLAGVLQVLLQTGRLQVQRDLPEAGVLRTEMQNFKAKIDPQTGHDTYAADWREGDHDDLVLSVAMACWFGEHGLMVPPAVIATPIPRLTGELPKLNIT